MIYQLTDGSWVQIGITNFGTGPEKCNHEVSRGFTRVRSFLQWIMSVTGIQITPFSCRGMPDGVYPNPSDCNTFFMCSNGNQFLFVSILCIHVLLFYLLMHLMCCFRINNLFRVAQPRWFSIQLANSVIIVTTFRSVKQINLPIM